MWWTGTATGLDFETDGKDPTDARMITGAVVQIAPGAVPLPIEIMAKPERPIDPGAIAVHGITTERAEAEGVEREGAVMAVVDQLALASETRPVVGHNISYDLTLLDREMRRLGLGCLGKNPETGFCTLRIDTPDRVFLGAFPVIDTYVLDKAIDKYRPGKRQLSFVAAHYGVPMADGAAHGATADVIASLRIAITIAGRTQWEWDDLIACYRDRRVPGEVAEMFQVLGRYELSDLHRAQRLWAVEQAEGLRRHFMKNPGKGDPDTVDGSWPFRPLRVDGAAEVVDTTII